MPFTNQTEEKQIERAVLVGLSCPSFNADQDADERTMDELPCAGGDCRCGGCCDDAAAPSGTRMPARLSVRARRKRSSSLPR